MKLSIIIPVFNEEKTIIPVLNAVDALEIPHWKKEIIIVDDGSKDKTLEKIEKFILKKKGIFQLVKHTKNLGKGAAVKTGISHAKGDYIIIQDADLEYNPQDIIKLVSKIKTGKEVVYGTRLNRLPHFSQEESRLQFATHYFGNKLLSFLTSILYGQWITDMETCYKLFPKKALNGVQLHAKGFEFEPEITAKLIKKGNVIHEISIITRPRGTDEGKKLHTVRDGIKALQTLFFYRFVD